MSYLTTTYPHSVTSADVDMYARMRPGAVVNLLIQAAITSADQLGFGFNELEQHKLFWVLSRLTIEFNKVPNWNAHLHVETWPKDVDRFLYLRDFIVRDKNEAIVLKATSGWLAVNMESKRPAIIEGIQANMFDELKNKRALDYPPEKLSFVPKGNSISVVSSYFDIDLNKHVTATRYIDWMMDTFSADFHEHHYPVKLSVNYLRETKLEEHIELRKMKSDNQRFDFEGYNLSQKHTAYLGTVFF